MNEPSNNDQEASATNTYDLEERTGCFGEAIIGFAKRIPITPVTRSPIDQLVRAETSNGANYCEADDAGPKKDFRHKIGLCRKEAKETKHWLRMLAQAVPEKKDDARELWREVRELNLIFSAMLKKSGK